MLPVLIAREKPIWGNKHRSGIGRVRAQKTVPRTTGASHPASGWWPMAPGKQVPPSEQCWDCKSQHPGPRGRDTAHLREAAFS